MKTVNLNGKEYQIEDELVNFINQLYVLYQDVLQLKSAVDANDGDKVIEAVLKVCGNIQANSQNN